MSRQHADELLARLDKASEEATKVLVAQHGTDAAEAARRAFDLASARRHGAIAMLEAMASPAEGAPQRDHARAFARGYVIARERTIVAGDYPPEGHEDHGSQPFLLAMGQGAAYAAASVPFWEAVYRWHGGIDRPRFPSSTTPEFIAKIDGEPLCLTYHEIQDQHLDLVVTDDLDADLYAGACEGRAALEREEGSWVTLSPDAQDVVLGLLDDEGEKDDSFAAAARALRHLAGRAEEVGPEELEPLKDATGCDV